jgi:hypothetical protein
MHLFTGNAAADDVANVSLGLDPPLGAVERFEAR